MLAEIHKTDSRLAIFKQHKSTIYSLSLDKQAANLTFATARVCVGY